MKKTMKKLATSDLFAILLSGGLPLALLVFLLVAVAPSCTPQPAESDAGQVASPTAGEASAPTSEGEEDESLRRPRSTDHGANAWKGRILARPKHPFVPMPPDPRAPDEIAQAACRAADGSWRCAQAKPSQGAYLSGARKLLSAGFISQTYLPAPAAGKNLGGSDLVVPENVFAAAGGVRPPIVPSTWTITTWHLRPATGLDTNDCVTSATSCQTFAEIAARWGTLAPRLATSNVTIAQHESQSASQLNTDPVTLTPRLGAPGGSASSVWLTYQCDLPAVSTATTATVVVAKNRTSNPGVELRVTVGAGGGVGRFYQNLTHPSFAWARQIQGAAFRMTQPLLTTAFSSVATIAPPMAAEVETWAVNDNINIYNSLLQVKMPKIRPYTDFMSQFENGFVVVKNCDLSYNIANENNGDASIDVGRNVQLVDGVSDHGVVVDDAYYNDNGVTAGSADWWYNGGFAGGFRGQNGAAANGSPSAGYWQILGGMGFSNQAQSPNWIMNGVHLDGDVVLAQGSGSQSYVFTGYNTLGFVDLEVANNTMVASGVADIRNFSLYGGNIVWSQLATPAFDAGYGTVVYLAGATGGATTFAGGVAPQLAGSTTACKFVPTAAAGNLVCNLSITTGGNLDTNLGATTGCLCGGAVGCFCNSAL